MATTNSVNPGDLDTLVQIRSCEITTGSQGQKQNAFTDHGQAYASVDRNADEAVGNGNLESGQTLVLTMYKVAGMTTRWQIIVGGKPYGVVAIDPISRFSPYCNVTVTAIDG